VGAAICWVVGPGPDAGPWARTPGVPGVACAAVSFKVYPRWVVAFLALPLLRLMVFLKMLEHLQYTKVLFTDLYAESSRAPLVQWDLVGSRQ
jgi:hypothetical protein